VDDFESSTQKNMLRYITIRLKWKTVLRWYGHVKRMEENEFVRWAAERRKSGVVDLGKVKVDQNKVKKGVEAI
jgi:hypothetical protein